MAVTNVWIGGAPAVQQVETYAPGTQPPNTTISATINGKTVSYLSVSGSNDDLVSGLTTAWAQSQIPEFLEVTPTATAYIPVVAAPNAYYLRLASKTPGTPFTVSFSLSQPARVQVARAVAGQAGKNEVQKVTISPNAESGWFTATFGGNTTGAIPIPPQPLSGVTAGSGSSKVAGTYQYLVTYTTAHGETEAGAPTSVVLVAPSDISLTNIPVSAAGSVTARNIYRTKVGGTTFYLLHTIGDNTTTTYTDSTADTGLGAVSPPPTNYAFEGGLQALASVGVDNAKVALANVPAVQASSLTNPSTQVVPLAFVYEVEFTGTLGNASQSLLTVDVTNVTVLPTITITEKVQGHPIQSEIQTVGWQQVIGAALPTGSWKIVLPVLGVTTGALAVGVAPADVAAAIKAVVPTAYQNSFAVSQSVGSSTSFNANQFTITYQGLLANQDVPQATVDVSNLLPATGDVVSGYWSTTQQGSATGADEQILLTIGNSPSSGNWALEILDQLSNTALLTSTAIAANATAGTVQAAIGATVCEVSGDQTNGYTITFAGELGARRLSFLWASQLSGTGPAPGSPPASNTTGLATMTLSSPGGGNQSGALPPGTYYYKMTAVDAVGESAPSNEISYTIPAGDTGIVDFLINSNVSGATSYKVYRGTTPGGENVLVATIPSGTMPNLVFRDGGNTNTAASPPGVDTSGGLSAPTGVGVQTGNGGAFSAGTYYWKVTATNASGETLPSSEASITLSACASAQVTYNSVTGATGYKVYRGTAPGAENVLVGVQTSSTFGQLSFIDDGGTGVAGTPPAADSSKLAAPVQNNTTPSATGGTLGTNTYYYEITAYNDLGETTASNEKSAAVTGPTGSVALSWGAVSHASGYKIYRGTRAGGENLLVATVANGATTTYTDTGSSLAASETVSRVQSGMAATTEVQTITLVGANGGSFQLAAANQLTGSIPYNETAANIQTDLQAILGSGNITISGSAGGPYTATYQGTLANSPQPLLGQISSGLIGTTSIVTSGTITQAATGPNNWDNGLNWSAGRVPITGDAVVIQNTNVNIQYGLAQSSVVLSSLQIDMSYAAGQLGLPNVNKTGKYPEYRQQYLQIGVSGKILIGSGTGSGPNLVKLDTGGHAADILVVGTGNRLDPSLPVVQWKGVNTEVTGSQTIINVTKGSFGAACFAGEQASIYSLSQGYESNPRTDSDVVLGAGVTCATFLQNGGTSKVNCSLTTLTMLDGTCEFVDGVSGASAVTTANIEGGTLYHRATGLVGALYVGSKGTYDHTRAAALVHIGQTFLYGGCTFDDRFTLVTFNTPFEFVNCGIEDVTLKLGKNISLQRS